MPALEFGRVQICRMCWGSGDEHAYRLVKVGEQEADPNSTSKPKAIKKRVRCYEHPCQGCKGTGIVPVGGG